MIVYGLVVLALGAHYIARLGAFAVGFARTARRSDDVRRDDACAPVVTVIVAARNEEAVIGRCVDAILACDYPEDRFEVIVSDDDSSDGTAEAVRQRIAARTVPVLASAEAEADEAPLRLVHVPHDPGRLRAHKKRAIEWAVEEARGEIVLTTDADCLVPRGWMRAMAGAFEDPEIVFASGPVRYAAHGGLFARLQALDFLGLMACGGGGIGIGRPNLANGASVGWRRDVFEQLGGFSGIDDVTSGDDELLMQKIAYDGSESGFGRHSVRFVNRPDAVVVTEPVQTVRAFFHQRRRWASKGTRYQPELQAMLVGFVLFFLALAGGTLALVFVPALWPWLLGGFGLKAIGDLAVLLPATRRFGQRHLLAAYPVYGVAHVFHSLFVGLVGPLSRGFEWKGRTLDQ
ncbi:MAG: glycosyltransferase [Bacteroidota bacterium]